MERDRLIVDTNVLVSAVLSEGGAARAVLRLCLPGEAVPLMGQALFAEYEDVFARTDPFVQSSLDRQGRDALLDAFLATCRWTRVSFLWRPNLPTRATTTSSSWPSPAEPPPSSPATSATSPAASCASARPCSPPLPFSPPIGPSSPEEPPPWPP